MMRWMTSAGGVGARWRLAAALATCAALIAALTSTAHGQSPYPLDLLERIIPRRGKVRCPKVPKVFYRGDHIRYHARVFVNRPFRERLRRFERVVAEVSTEIYGRAPRAIRHVGTYNCRRIAAWPTFLSEHGLANGIDVTGFDFGPAPRALRKRLPRALRGRFRVRVRRHWTAKRASEQLHQRFLRLLIQRLVDRGDHVFRVLLGPGYPGHDDHFHFDMAPWRLIDFAPMPAGAQTQGERGRH